MGNSSGSTILKSIKQRIAARGGDTTGLSSIADALERLDELDSSGDGSGSSNLQIKYIGKVAFSISGDFSNVTLTEDTTEVDLSLPSGTTLPQFDFYSVASESNGTYSNHVNYIGFSASPDLATVQMKFAKSTSYPSEVVYSPNINFNLYKLAPNDA